MFWAVWYLPILPLFKKKNVSIASFVNKLYLIRYVMALLSHLFVYALCYTKTGFLCYISLLSPLQVQLLCKVFIKNLTRIIRPSHVLSANMGTSDKPNQCEIATRLSFNTWFRYCSSEEINNHIFRKVKDPFERMKATIITRELKARLDSG